MDKYDPAKIEPKWQAEWEKENLYKTPEPTAQQPKKYILDMFPYPSGAVLHVGHMEGYVGTDVVSRYYRMKGFSVLHPMGWDAFGLPAENYAIKTGIHPDKSTHDNINTFRNQLKMLGLSYDWDREVDTSSPDYYKWTQWIFTRLFKMGLAYKAKAAVNWCPKDETVLANEQVENGVCERCGTPVVQKDLDQWFFKITAYADRLIEGLDRINWPDSTKAMQKNWIGKKTGAKIKFPLVQDVVQDEVLHKASEGAKNVEIFTTRPDTIFGATFVVLAPDHPLAHKVEKVVNPATGKEIPVFVDEYVVSGVGTGAIMGVPAHDERDFEFAKKNSLPIVRVVKGPEGSNAPINQVPEVFTGEGSMVNSGDYDGMKSSEAFVKIVKDLEKRDLATLTTVYHLRDWLISRQRYWGAPIPMIFCEKCNWQPVPESDLPVMLPTDVDFKPTGESPIARSKTFQKGAKCPKCGGPARREVDTMDTFVDSSWYFIRFADPHNQKEFTSKDLIKKWLPIDTYVGGGHTVQHLLFARFFQKALVDMGLIPSDMDEPFIELKVPGWILGPDSRKMSKRWGNVITPDEVVKQYGADTMRMYEMFMAPFEVDKPWNVNSVAGVHRFVNRIYGLAKPQPVTNPVLVAGLNRLIDKVGRDIAAFRFNTAIAAMMKFVNAWEKNPGLAQDDLEKFILILAPFTPHLAEELWSHFAKASRDKHDHYISIHTQPWPKVEESSLEEMSATLAIAINGKTRATMEIGTKELQVLSEAQIVAKAKTHERVAEHLRDKTIRRAVYVPGKIINFVV